MFVSIFAIDSESGQKVFRSSKELSQSKISFYLTEFITQPKGPEGIIEKETYDYVYTSNGPMFYVAQVLKSAFLIDAMESLRFIKNGAQKNNIYDILLFIDNILYGSTGIFDDLRIIGEMESQDEKIYKLMMENKKQEMAEKAKEHERQAMNQKLVEEYRESMGIKEETVPKPVPAKMKIEKSSEPVLLILKEKISIKCDKENFIKENSVSGELSMVISSAEHRNVQLKMVNSPPGCKFSPYLDKNALKKNIFKFDKERQLNKNIPLLKWTGKVRELPLILDYWVDEDEGKYCNTLTINASRSVKNLRIKINAEEISDLEIDGVPYSRSKDVVLKADSIAANSSVNFEVKNTGFDLNGIFPLQIAFEEGVESKISIEEVTLGEKVINCYEFRRLIEIEKYEIVSE